MEGNVPADVASSFDSQYRNSLRLKVLLRVLSDSDVISPEQMGEIWHTDIGDSFDMNGARITSLLDVLLEAGKITEKDMEVIWAGETPTPPVPVRALSAKAPPPGPALASAAASSARLALRSDLPERASRGPDLASAESLVVQRGRDERSRSPHRQRRDGIYQPESCRDLDPPVESEIPRALQSARNVGLPHPPCPVEIAYQVKSSRTFFLWCASCRVWIADLKFSSQAGKCEGSFGRCPHFDGRAYEAMLKQRAAWEDE